MANRHFVMHLFAMTIAIWIIGTVTTNVEAFWPFDQMFASSQSSQTPPGSTNQTNSSAQFTGSPTGQPRY